MSVEENNRLIRRYIEALSGKDKPRELIEQFVSDEKLTRHIEEVEAAFPRYSLTAEDMIGDEDRVVVRLTAQMRHECEFMGVPPTGRNVQLAGIIIYRIAGGKIAEYWLQIDVPGLMQQLTGSVGVHPASA